MPLDFVNAIVWVVAFVAIIVAFSRLGRSSRNTRDGNLPDLEDPNRDRRSK
jgi:hypothetical protein